MPCPTSEYLRRRAKEEAPHLGALNPDLLDAAEMLDDMLAALRQAEVALRHCSPIDGAERMALDDIHAAIAKAEGRTP